MPRQCYTGLFLLRRVQVEGVADDDGTPRITVKIMGQDGAEMVFKTKRTTILEKLIDKYCENFVRLCAQSSPTPCSHCIAAHRQARRAVPVYGERGDADQHGRFCEALHQPAAPLSHTASWIWRTAT